MSKSIYENIFGEPSKFDSMEAYAYGYQKGKTDEWINNKKIEWDICQILFEGEDTETGRKITIDRIKEYVNFDDWLSK